MGGLIILRLTFIWLHSNPHCPESYHWPCFSGNNPTTFRSRNNFETLLQPSRTKLVKGNNDSELKLSLTLCNHQFSFPTYFQRNFVVVKTKLVELLLHPASWMTEFKCRHHSKDLQKFIVKISTPRGALTKNDIRAKTFSRCGVNPSKSSINFEVRGFFIFH